MVKKGNKAPRLKISVAPRSIIKINIGIFLLFFFEIILFNLIIFFKI